MLERVCVYRLVYSSVVSSVSLCVTVEIDQPKANRAGHRLFENPRADQPALVPDIASG